MLSWTSSSPARATKQGLCTMSQDHAEHAESIPQEVPGLSVNSSGSFKITQAGVSSLQPNRSGLLKIAEVSHARLETLPVTMQYWNNQCMLSALTQRSGCVLCKGLGPRRLRDTFLSQLQSKQSTYSARSNAMRCFLEAG